MREYNSYFLVVDDDRSMRESLHDLLGSMGLNVQTFASAHEFLASPRPEAPGCLVLDVQLPGLSGLELQQELARGAVPMPIIFLTGHGDIPMSVQTMKAGAVSASCPRTVPVLSSLAFAWPSSSSDLVDLVA